MVKEMQDPQQKITTTTNNTSSGNTFQYDLDGRKLSTLWNCLDILSDKHLYLLGIIEAHENGFNLSKLKTIAFDKVGERSIERFLIKCKRIGWVEEFTPQVNPYSWKGVDKRYKHYKITKRGKEVYNFNLDNR